MKTYILQFKYKEGNGWAIINAHSPNQAEQVFYTQTKFDTPNVVSMQESNYYGEEMQLVYEGSISTLNANLYSLAVLNGFEGSLDDFIQSQKGEKGDKGDKGDTGGDGKNGTNGKSAYEVAVDNGFYGTEEDWLKSLKGTDGHNGQDGTDGINGIDGTDGVSIQSVEQTTTSHVSEGENIITVTLTNGNTYTFSVFNGEKGADGSGGEGVEQIQSDWAQSDSTKKDYIKNKPTLATVATSGNYNDLSNKPTIPDAQVQANWNESNSSSKAYIQNKPSLATVATSGSYNDLSNKPTIPDAQIQADWNQTTSTAKDYIKNKPTIPAAQVNADWNASSGVALILNKPTIPTVPTNVSAFTNDAGYLTQHQSIKTVNGTTMVGTGNVSTETPVVEVSGATVTQTLSPNTFYKFTGAVTSLTLTLGSEVSGITNIYAFCFTAGVDNPTITLPQGVQIADAPTIANGDYVEFNIMNNKAIAKVWSAS